MSSVHSPDNVLDSLDFLHASMSQLSSLVKQQIKSIPKYVDEAVYNVSSQTVTLQPQSQNLERIIGLLAVVSSSGAMLTLGKRTIPLPIGTTYWNGLCFLLSNDDPRTLTQSANGLLSLELFGEELADKGVF